MPTPNMGMTEPTPGGSSGTWGALLNACLDTIDGHSHQPGSGVRIATAAIALDADLSFGGGLAAKDLKAADFTPVTTASVSGYSSALFTNSADNNLYFRNSGGTNIQITAGGGLNFSVTGGIGGDYTSVGALLDFIDANDTYHFYQQIGSAVRQYAGVAMGNLDIFEQKAQPAGGVPTTRVRHKSPASLAASYDLTWLTALPGSTLSMQVSSTGSITASNTFASALVAPDFKANANRVMNIGACGFVAINSNARVTDGAGNTSVNLNGGAGNTSMCTMPLPIFTGDRVNSVKIFIQKTTSNTTTITATLRDLDNTAGSSFSTDTAANSANNPGFTTITITPASPHALAANHSMSVAVNITAGAGTTDNVFGVEISYDRP